MGPDDEHSVDLPALEVRRALEGARVLVLGGTGFLGKVLLFHLLSRFEPAEVIVGVRPPPGGDAAVRLERDVWTSPCLAPLLEGRHGDPAKHRARLHALSVDVARPRAAIDDDALAALARQPPDVVINLAGVVRFDGALDRTLRVNALGAEHAASLAQALGGAPLVHVSTCFVAGARTGDVLEEPLRAQGDARADVDEALHAAAELRARLRASSSSRAAVAEALRDEGMRRARARGFPNTYTWSKALGERLLARSMLRHAIVRPSIVESTTTLPFPGWNEGMTTSAPLVYLGYLGHRVFPSRAGHVLDVVPADFVSSALCVVAAALLAGDERGAGVFQVATGEVNPLAFAPLPSLSDEAFVRHDGARRRVHPVVVTARRYRLTSTPLLRRATSLAARTSSWLARGSRSGALADLAARLTSAERRLRSVEDVLEAFLPFTGELDYRFSSARLRALLASVPLDERARLPCALESIEWTSYWRDVHVPGLLRWVFPALERRPAF